MDLNQCTPSRKIFVCLTGKVLKNIKMFHGRCEKVLYDLFGMQFLPSASYFFTIINEEGRAIFICWLVASYYLRVFKIALFFSYFNLLHVSRLVLFRWPFSLGVGIFQYVIYSTCSFMNVYRERTIKVCNNDCCLVVW